MDDDGVVLNVIAFGRVDQSNITRNLEEGHAVPSSTHAMSSLPVMSVDYETNETLMNCLLRNTKATRFLQYTANYWADTNWLTDTTSDKLSKALYTAALVILVALFLIMLASIVINSVLYQLAPILVAATVALDILSVLPAQYLNQQRMRRKAFILDANVIDESLRIATYFGIFCAFATFASIIVLLFGIVVSPYYYLNLFSLAIAQLLTSMYLAFNLFFLMMDLKASSLLIDQLFLLADKQMLTVEKFNMVRSDIHRRVKKSQFASDFIVGPCIASIISILVLFYHLDYHYLFISLAWMIALTKELVFIFIAFWYVAKVNGRADELTRQLSSTVWLATHNSVAYNNVISSSICGVHSSTTVGVGPVGLVQRDTMQQCLDRCDNMQTDMQRMTICVSCFTDPISFTLLFKRVSWQNVAASAAGFAVTLFVAVVKIIVGASSV